MRRVQVLKVHCVRFWIRARLGKTKNASNDELQAQLCGIFAGTTKDISTVFEVHKRNLKCRNELPQWNIMICLGFLVLTYCKCI